MGDSLGDVVGRERELAEVGAFLSAVPDGPSALLIDGDAGIGKTTVWLTAVRNAEDHGYRVLRARPAESESRLSYAALADIVGPVFEEIRSALPDPQERALATVMLRVATDGAGRRANDCDCPGGCARDVGRQVAGGARH